MFIVYVINRAVVYNIKDSKMTTNMEPKIMLRYQTRLRKILLNEYCDTYQHLVEFKKRIRIGK